MSAKSIELRQERARLIEENRAMLDLVDAEKREFTPEENEQYGKRDNVIDNLKIRFEREEAQERRDLEVGEFTESADTRGAPPGEKPEGDASIGAWNRFLRSGTSALAPEEFRALQSDKDEAGGYLRAPVQWVSTLLQALDNLVFVRNGRATIQKIPTAQSLGAPSLDADPADPTWTSEILTGSADTTMDFGKRELHPMALAQSLLVSRKLLRQAPDSAGIVQSRLAYKTAVVHEYAFLNGTGSGQPLGVFTASDFGISTGRDISTGNTGTSITFDGLISAQMALKPQYRAQAEWCFHTDGVTQVRKLKNGEGDYIWKPGGTEGKPDILLGRPLIESVYAPNTFTTGLYVGLLGVWSYYWIADALDLEIQRLDELYAATNQVGFYSRSETDGMPVLEEAFVRVKLG